MFNLNPLTTMIDLELTPAPVPYTPEQEQQARDLLDTLINLPDPVRVAMAHNLGACQGALDFLAALRQLSADYFTG